MAKALSKRSEKSAGDQPVSSRLERQILQSRAQALAARGRQTVDGERLPRLVVQTGGDLFGLAPESVAQVAPMPRLAAAGGPPALLGVFSHGGRLYGALDLSVLLGLTPGAQGGAMLILRDQPWPLALRADAALGVMPVALLEDVAAEHAAKDAIGGRALMHVPGAAPRALSLLNLAGLMDGFTASLAFGARP